jgi:hypothetical protein
MQLFSSEEKIYAGISVIIQSYLNEHRFRQELREHCLTIRALKSNSGSENDFWFLLVVWFYVIYLFESLGLFYKTKKIDSIFRIVFRTGDYMFIIHALQMLFLFAIFLIYMFNTINLI